MSSVVGLTVLYIWSDRSPPSQSTISEAYLDESNVGGLLTEALTADVKTVLADETGLVGADAAVHIHTLATSILPIPTMP